MSIAKSWKQPKCPSTDERIKKTRYIYIYTYIYVYTLTYAHRGFPAGSDGKESASNAGDLGSTPGLGRFPEEGNDYPLQYSCLENSMDREAWGTCRGPWDCKQSDTTE